jgi:DNA-binding NarL/FixJ family response regulator
MFASPVRFSALRRRAPVCDDVGLVGNTVLIVDDHPSFRASARAVLEADGFEVVGEAADGAAAVAAYRVLRPDVILLDVQLPDANGFDLCEFLCEDALPSIVLVSSRDAADFDGLVEKGPARGFISKADLSGDALRALLA